VTLPVLRRKDDEEEPKPLPSTAEAAQRKVDAFKEQIRRAEFQMQEKDSNKTVSLGTSKINYLDPRITVAWCKLHKIPVSKLFTKSLIDKFPWAMAVEEDFVF
jgi:DNA topoisomerase-1